MQKLILADGRWFGTHGIGRFAHEVLSRLKKTEILTSGPPPLSVNNLAWQARYLYKNKARYKVFFNPGYNPILLSSIPYVLTIHDLIHLFAPGSTSLAKKMYYKFLMKPSAKNAYKILTVSEYSKKNIIEWANIPERNIVVVGNGISHQFNIEGATRQPGYPYLLHVGNNKPHKNLARLIQAFAVANIDPSLRLILTSALTNDAEALVKKYHLENRIIIHCNISDEKLAEYYRGATAFLFPSLYEGFGIPVIEAMSCGTPTLVSNVTSLPEIAGDAAVLVDPNSIESITQGIEKIVLDTTLRENLIRNGLERVKLFSWDKTAAKVQLVLNGLAS